MIKKLMLPRVLLFPGTVKLISGAPWNDSDTLGRASSTYIQELTGPKSC